MITVALENFPDTFQEMYPIYESHYSEMNSHFQESGICLAPLKVRFDVFANSNAAGSLLLFVVRQESKAIGYAIIHLTQDLHNFEFTAHDGAVYILPEHRNGRAGIKLLNAIQDELRSIKVARFFITTMTDLKVTKLLGRLGFKHLGNVMCTNFGV